MEVYNALQIKKGAKVEGNTYTIRQPLQFILDQNKTDDWKRQNMDWLEKIGLDQINAKYKRLLKNYRLANDIIDKRDYIADDDNESLELINILTDDDSEVYDLKFYPLISNVLKVMIGEFSKRSDKILYRAIDDYTFNEMLEEKRKAIEEVLMQYGSYKMQQQIQELGLDLEDEEQAQQAQQMMEADVIKKLPEIETFFKKDYRSIGEQWAMHQHNVDYERFRIKEKEITAFGDVLITDSEFWHMFMGEDDYDIELWNPVLTFYKKSPETKYISNGSLVGKIDVMSASDIIDKYGYKMTREQLESFEAFNPNGDVGYVLNGLSNDGSYYNPSLSYSENIEGPSLGMRQYQSFQNMFGSLDVIDEVLNTDTDTFASSIENSFRVTTAYWKSKKLIGHVSKIDETGITRDFIVDETYKVTDKPIYDNSVRKDKSKRNLIYGEHIDWIWINQVYGGVKINTHNAIVVDNNSYDFKPIYLDVGPLKYQFKGDNNLYGCKLPVEGCIFSERNTESRAFVDKMKPHQIGYNLVNNQISDILIDELGTVIMFDQNILPQHSMDEDWGRNNLAKAYVAMKNFQMLPVDSTLSNTESTVAFQHAQVLNLEETNRLMSRVNLANYFKQQCFESVGMSPQRMANILAQETATGIEQAISMSHAQTEIYFVQHSEHLMPRVHEMRTNLAQYYHSTKPSVRLQYMTSMEERVNFAINGRDLLLRDFNVYVTTKVDQKMMLEQIKSLALNNNTTGATIYDLGNIIKTESLGELDTILKKIEEKAEEQIAEQQKMTQQLEEMRREEEQQKFMFEKQFEANENDKDRASRERVAAIRAAGYSAAVDINENERSDYLDALDYLDKREEREARKEAERRKDEQNMNIEHRKLSVKEKEIRSKENIAEKELQVAKANKNYMDLPKKDRDKVIEKKK